MRVPILATRYHLLRPGGAHMAVTSSTFGAVRLTAKDAKKFRDQMTYGRPMQAAVDACARGKEAAQGYAVEGFAVIRRKRP
jgi:hypothetical protein